MAYIKNRRRTFNRMKKRLARGDEGVISKFYYFKTATYTPHTSTKAELAAKREKSERTLVKYLIRDAA